MNNLQVECSKCKISTSCPKKGSIPITLFSGKKLLCTIIGGYSKTPVDKSILSNDSLNRYESDGQCLSIAEIPVKTGVGLSDVVYEIIKIFHKPVLHPRESVPMSQSLLDQRSHK